MDEQDEYVWVVVGEEESSGPASMPGAVPKGGNLHDSFTEKLAAARRVSVAELEQKMSQFLTVVGRLFRQAEQQAQMTAASSTQPAGKNSRLQLDEVEMSIEITAGGEVKLIAGGKAETKGSIKLKFKRVDG